jgi:hypothetical protein
VNHPQPQTRVALSFFATGEGSRFLETAVLDAYDGVAGSAPKRDDRRTHSGKNIHHNASRTRSETLKCSQ